MKSFHILIEATMRYLPGRRLRWTVVELDGLLKTILMSFYENFEKKNEIVL